MLTKHYAPTTPLYILQLTNSSVPGISRAMRAEGDGDGGTALLSLDGNLGGIPLDKFAHVEILSRTGNLEEAASKFFETIRQLDAMHFSAIVAIPVKEKGLGAALMDRLRRGSQSVT